MSLSEFFLFFYPLGDFRAHHGRTQFWEKTQCLSIFIAQNAELEIPSGRTGVKNVGSSFLRKEESIGWKLSGREKE